VLLVEDDDDSREALCLALELAGAAVHGCASALEARGAMETAIPDVIVSDIGMPGENGYAFLKAVRASGILIPAVAITGFASTQDREEARSAGFDDLVAKPVNTDTLVRKLRDIVRRSGPRWRDQARTTALGFRAPATLPPARGA
jgi:DNA-binding response OmpR family regulator